MSVGAEALWTDERLRRARWLILVWLATSVVTSLLMPGIGLWRENDTPVIVLGAIGIVLFCLAQAGVMYAAVTPWLPSVVRRRLLMVFIITSLASLPLVGPVATGEWLTWSWLGAGVIATAPLLARPWTAAAAALLCTAASVVIALLIGGPIANAFIITAGIGASLALVNWSPVWLWDLLVQAQRGRDARARLAVTEERLRFARDVHDLLGHNLTVIALKAELTARLTAADPAAACAEADRIQQLAASALTEMRQTVHSYRLIDLDDELRSVQQVLASSGVKCTVEPADAPLPAEAAARFAPLLREAATNILRHSQASWCRITIENVNGQALMTVTNDGAAGVGADSLSYGLQSMATRLQDSGGTLRTGLDGSTFVLEAATPTGAEQAT